MIISLYYCVSVRRLIVRHLVSFTGWTWQWKGWQWTQFIQFIAARNVATSSATPPPAGGPLVSPSWARVLAKVRAEVRWPTILIAAASVPLRPSAARRGVFAAITNYVWPCNGGRDVTCRAATYNGLHKRRSGEINHDSSPLMLSSQESPADLLRPPPKTTQKNVLGPNTTRFCTFLLQAIFRQRILYTGLPFLYRYELLVRRWPGQCWIVFPALAANTAQLL